jgi:TolA-binding protein
MDINQLIEICKDTERRESRLRTITKDAIADILAKSTATHDTSWSSNDDLRDRMTAILDEMKQMRETQERMVVALGKIKRLERELDSVKQENTEMRQQLTRQEETIMRQQTFLERIDQRERAENLIIVGIPENQEADDDKVREILAKIKGNDGTPPNVKKIKRIGTQEAGKTRAILITVDNEDERNEIAKKAKSTAGLGGIRVKKDCHPAVRAEWTRLFGVKEAEETKAENEGKSVAINFKKRCVTIDGRVIDTWRQPF